MHAGIPPLHGTRGRPPHLRRHPPGLEADPLGRHPPPSACWKIRSTSGWYAFHWNAFLYTCSMLPSATKLQKGNVFTHVCGSVHGGWRSVWQTPPGQTPPGQTRPGQTPSRQTPPPPRRPLQRTVRILLDCILVFRIFRIILANLSMHSHCTTLSFFLDIYEIQ